MRLNRISIYYKVLLITAIVLSTRINGLAQSSIDLIAHYIDVTSRNDGISYNVDIYISVLDSGNPIPELKPEDLVIQEDGQKIEIQNLRPLTEEPVNVVLVVDTSADMSETDISDAKSAAIAFISRLKPSDKIALITFDSSAKNQVDELTSDHQKIIDIITNKIFATREAGTCLYDAAFSALKMFTPQPAGSRAVILLTNGKDETAIGAKCSDHTDSEVVDNASEGALRAPIYVIGLEVDEKSEDGRKDYEILKSFVEQSGGLYQNLSSSSKLANVFDELSTLLRAQYIITYTSISLPGPHNVLVSFNTPNQSVALVSDTRKLSLEPIPPHLTFMSPQEDDNISDFLKIAVNLTTQGGAVVERVAFEVNGSREGEDETKPYEIELDAQKYPVGLMTISATAYGENNTELARTSINVIRIEITATVEVELVPTQENIPLVETPVFTATPTNNNNSVVFMAIGLSSLSILAIGVLIFFLLRQQKQATIRDLEKYVETDNTLPPIQGIPVFRKPAEDRKAISSEAESDALGALTIEASDDPTLIGHRFEIAGSLVTLGRNADNDIIFPSDKPVSRHHAEIYQISGNLYLREVEKADASGTAQPPKYGTFLNQVKMGADPAQLNTGDEIQLGKRVRLRFESYIRDMEGDALTYDEDDDDNTVSDDDDGTVIQD